LANWICKWRMCNFIKSLIFHHLVSWLDWLASGTGAESKRGPHRSIIVIVPRYLCNDCIQRSAWPSFSLCMICYKMILLPKMFNKNWRRYEPGNNSITEDWQYWMCQQY
jgi:hypothetical protein